MGRFIQTSTAATATLTTCYSVSNHKYSYNANECWQNKVVIDTPGNYTFTVPSGASCIRVVAVGGGGKACVSDFYCNFAGAGGAYVEAVDTISSGCQLTIVVGRQQQDTTITYTCSGGTAVTHTAGGAVACTAGTASSTSASANLLMRSNGGPGGIGRNNQQSHGTCPSTCLCMYTTTCCGYCITYGCNCHNHVNNESCNPYYPGGGSAGSFMFTRGGCGQHACHKGPAFTCNDTGGSVAGGGGGIGYLNVNPVYSAFCDCACDFGSGNEMWRACGPASAGGGYGSRYTCCASACEQMLWNGTCTNWMWREGAGGWGAPDNQEGRPGGAYIVCHDSTGCHKHYRIMCSVAPKCYPWHDIHSMSGSGSPGKSIHNCGGCSIQGNIWVRGYNMTGRPEDAGEGAGTGGIVYNFCSGYFADWDDAGTAHGINWQVVCQLGLCNSANDVYRCGHLAGMMVPGQITRAGTLGGSGGVGMLSYASKAGPGGGAGMYKQFIHCVCWGGSFNLCNGSGPALAFPPCILDNISSNAGSGMAIIYWKDA